MQTMDVETLTMIVGKLNAGRGFSISFQDAAGQTDYAVAFVPGESFDQPGVWLIACPNKGGCIVLDINVRCSPYTLVGQNFPMQVSAVVGQLLAAYISHKQGNPITSTSDLKAPPRGSAKKLLKLK